MHTLKQTKEPTRRRVPASLFNRTDVEARARVGARMCGTSERVSQRLAEFTQIFLEACEPVNTRKG